MVKKRFANFELSAAALNFLKNQNHAGGAPVNEQVEFTCAAKAEAAAREGVVSQMAGKKLAEVVIVSDTIVADPDDPLMPMGKPEDEQHAMAMLLRLSGNRHRVWSSTALVYPPNGTENILFMEDGAQIFGRIQQLLNSTNCLKRGSLNW
ncbi:MAG: hypothetical protein Ct9H90mP23_1810 [Methanobacteriota archaeon]|nr:MAG: hypothetical protein Ct9H90mP23_1810 [Euryarchaeota archaeon]